MGAWLGIKVGSTVGASLGAGVGAKVEISIPMAVAPAIPESRREPPFAAAWISEVKLPSLTAALSTLVTCE